MKTVLDFNGYFDSSNRFHFKEYSLYSLNNYGTLKKQVHEIVKPGTNFENLDNVTQQNYMSYYNKYSIPWTSRTHAITELSHLTRSEFLFVADHQKEQLLRNYLNHTSNGLQSSLMRLQDVGYKPISRTRSSCSHHKNRHSDCAEENGLDMLEFVQTNKLFDYRRLDRLNVAIDFSEYGSGYLGIKELAVVFIDYNGNVGTKKLEVMKESSNSQSKVEGFTNFFRRHGISWGNGTKDFNDLRFGLNAILEQALFVFVKDSLRKEILCQVNESARNKIINLGEFGYKPELEVGWTNCRWHNSKTYNCAKDNLMLMVDWMVERELYNKSKRDFLMQTQIVTTDFSRKQSHAEARKRKADEVNESSKRQRNEEIDKDYEEYLSKHNLKSLVFDPEVFDHVTSEFEEKIDEVQDLDELQASDSLDELLASDSSPEVMETFDPDLFEQFLLSNEQN